MKRLLAIAALCLPLAAQTVAINDTITLADGTAWRGTVEVSWPAFTTATGTAVARGSRTVAVLAGTLSISLYPNEGSAPTVAYTATFRGNGSWSETWSLAASPSITTLRAVRRSSTLTFFPSQIIATGKADGTYCLSVASDAVAGLVACGSAWADITGKPSTFAPSAHASTHASAGSDPVTPAAIGAEPANANIQAHIASTANPHGVTAAQVGLGSADNTSDAAKPVSAAQQAALDAKLDKAGGTITGTLAMSASLLTNAEYNVGTCTTAATISAANGNRQKVTLTAAQTCALTFTQPTTGTVSIQLKVIQSSAGAFSGAISGGKWPGGAAPTITKTSGAVDFLTCYLDGTNAYCAATQDFR